MPHAERSPLEPEPVAAIDPMAPQVLDEGLPIPERDIPVPLIDTEPRLRNRSEEPLDTAIASPTTIIDNLEKLLLKAQQAQRNGVNDALAALSHRSTPAPDWATRLLGGIVELVVALPLGLIGAALTNALTGGGDASKGVISQLARIASRFGRSANDAVTGSVGGGGDLDLFERYRVGIENEILATQARAEIDLGLARDQLATLSPVVLGQMADRLRPTSGLMDRLREEQRQAVLFGWARLCGGITRETDAIARSRADGFVDVYVSCPERIDGARGCQIERIDTNSHPSVAALVSSLPRGIVTVPVHRRVFLATRGSGAGFGWYELAYELDPDHQISVFPNASLLAAIGSGGISATGELRHEIEHHQALAGAVALNDVLSNTPVRTVQ